MALRIQPSFISGELDPALHEYTTLDKYKTALATARNVLVSNTGRVVSAPGRKWLVQTKLADRRVILHTVSDIGIFFEWGHEYVRVYNLYTGTIIGEREHTFDEDDLDNITFLNVGVDISTFKSTTMVFLEGQFSFILEVDVTLSSFNLYSSPSYFTLPTPPEAIPATTDVVATGGSTGYQVAYAVTRVVDGQESAPYYCTNYVAFPLTAAQYNTVYVDVFADVDNVSEVRVYRKVYTTAASNVPVAFGFIGKADPYVGDGRARFKDIGVAADYENSPPEIEFVTSGRHPTGASAIKPKTGTVYQQKLILSDYDNIRTSRTGFATNFTRDYPLNADSSLHMKLNALGKVLFLQENDGLVVFTSSGVFVHKGELSPTNLSLSKKGSWIIDSNIPPLKIPGGILFVDSATNVVRHFIQTESEVYAAEEVSLFSNHLFSGNKIRSWSYQDGHPSTVHVCFTDGTTAMLSYERELGLKAWSRADFVNPVEWVESSRNGLGFNAVTLVQTITCPADVASSLDQKGVIINYAGGTIGFWIDVNDNGTTIPAWASSCTTSFEVTTITAGMTAAQVAEEMAIAIEEYPGDLFSVSRSGGATFTMYGGTTVGSSGGGSDFTLTQITASTSSSSPDQLLPSKTLFVTKNSDGTRHIEFSVPRYVSSTIADADPESDKNESMAAMTAMVSWSQLLNDDLVGADVFTFTPTSPGVWDGTLTLTCGTSAVFTNGAGNPGNVGAIIRHFDGDGCAVDLEVTARASNNSITVQPSSLFPEDYATTARLYLTKATFDGLDHMEGENVAVISDGYVLASPNNDLDIYPVVTVTGGEITLPDGMTGAIVHVGRPYTMDVETLDIDTVEQRPVLIESLTVNKLYIKVLNSFGFYAGGRFPKLDNSLLGVDPTNMEYVQLTLDVDYEEATPIVGNRYNPPVTKRVEVMLKGDWKSRGRVCIRQVDPVHFEILSIMPDITDLRRTDRIGDENG